MLKLKADNIAGILDHEQIAYLVESISERISEYSREEDINMLEKLRDLCKRKK